MMTTKSSKQQQLEEFVLNSLLPRVEEAVRHRLRTRVTGGQVFTCKLGASGGINIAVSLEGNFDLSNLKLAERRRDDSLLN